MTTVAIIAHAAMPIDAEWRISGQNDE